MCRGDYSKFKYMIYLVLRNKSNISLLYNRDGTKTITIAYYRKDTSSFDVVQFELRGRRFLAWNGQPNTEIVEMFRPEIKILLDYPEHPQGEF